MKVFKYSRKEAIKNKCYNKALMEPLKYIMLFTLLIMLLLAFEMVVLPFLLTYIFPKMEILIYLMIPITIIVLPVVYYSYMKNYSRWFERAYILDDDKSVWLVEQFHEYNPMNVYFANDNIDVMNDAMNDNIYIEILNKTKEHKKTRGEAIKLTNLYLQQETRKYYICKYTNLNGYIERIKILKSYEDINEILRK